MKCKQGTVHKRRLAAAAIALDFSSSFGGAGVGHSLSRERYIHGAFMYATNVD